jgi:hypothetical protein
MTHRTTPDYIREVAAETATQRDFLLQIAARMDRLEQGLHDVQQIVFMPDQPEQACARAYVEAGKALADTEKPE